MRLHQRLSAPVLLASLFAIACGGPPPDGDSDAGRDAGTLDTPPMCGDGVINPGERCDGDCPTSCDDGIACTQDRLTGSAAACDAACEHTPVEACVDADGCCAPGCASIDDDDCSPSCGDGVLDPGETCDGDCPTSCDDGVACTADSLVGSAASCSASCSSSPITTCADSDGCCAPGCDASNDDDCSASCGNGVVEPGESCDGDCPSSCDDSVACTTDVLSGSTATCNVACSAVPVTACTSGDGCCAPGCNATNDSDCSPTCGNGVLEAGELCDGDCPSSCGDTDACTTDVLSGSAAGCSAACSHSPVTACTSGDGCCAPGCNATNDSDCSPSCGNGVLETGELCDGDCPTACDDGVSCTADSLSGAPETCDAQCVASPITACAHGDGCCPSGCLVSSDDDCVAVCGTDAELCTARSVECGPLTATDSCGGARSLDCGACSAGEVCGANGLASRCGLEQVFDATQTGGTPVSLAPALMSSDIAAIEAVSATEVWVGGGNQLVRVRTDSAELFLLDASLGNVRGFWSSSPSDVWVRTSTGVARFDGTSWTAIATGLAAGEVVALHGTASDDVWAATTSEIRHYDGASWSTWPAPAGFGSIRDIHGVQRGRPYVIQGGSVYRYNGLSYVELTDSPYASSRVWISPIGTVFVLSQTSDGGYYSSQSVHRLDGSSWTSLFSVYRSHLGCTYASSEVDLEGTSDTEVWFGTCWGASYRYDGSGAPIALGPTGAHLVSPTGVDAGFYAGPRTLYERVAGDSVPRFDRGTNPSCGAAYRSGSGQAWLLCDGGRLARLDGGFTYDGTSGLSAIFASSASSLWLAHDDGTLEKRAAGASTTYTDYLGSEFLALAGTSDSDMWAMTGSGVAHFDGTTWSAALLPVTSPLTSGDLAVSSDAVWAWAYRSTYRWNGASWVEVALPAPAGTYEVTVVQVAVQGSETWLLTQDYGAPASQRYRLYRRDGASWALQTSFASASYPSLSSGLLGIVTGHTAASGYVLEQWTSSGSTPLTTLTFGTAWSSADWLLLLDPNDLLFTRSNQLFRIRF